MKSSIRRKETSNKKAPKHSDPTVDYILNLQRTIGNKNVEHLLKSNIIQPELIQKECGAIQAKEARSAIVSLIGQKDSSLKLQTKLTVGSSNDIYEQEADRVAEQVVNMPDADVRKKAASVNVQAGGVSAGSFSVGSGVESQIRGMQGGGQPFPESVGKYYQARFGYEFNNVRVHTGSKAHKLNRALNSRAFTIGNDIFFAKREYNNSKEGKKLIAHELSHVIQQKQSVFHTAIQRKTVPKSSEAAAKKIESLLSYGVFDWEITDSDAIKALEILSNMPVAVQRSLIRRINIGRLKENLPNTHKPILARILTQAGGKAPKAVLNKLEKINSFLSYSAFDWAITDADAKEAFRLIKFMSSLEQKRVIPIIDHQRLYENLPTKAERKEFDTLRRPILTNEKSELKTMEGYRIRAEGILKQIKTRAKAMTIPSPSATGKFEKWLTEEYLKDYLKKPGEATAKKALERMTVAGHGGFKTYGYALLRGMASSAKAKHISYIDSPHFLGTPSSSSVTATGFFDPWSQGPNLTDIMHFAAGLKWAWAPSAIVQWFFVYYEKKTKEGWQLFGLDALNDIIAEEGARLFARDLLAGTVRATGGSVDLDPYFVKGRKFLKSELNQRDLDRVALRVFQPNMVIGTKADGSGVINRKLWNNTIMEQVMAGQTDPNILNSPDGKILTMLYHLILKG
ncbi:MAG: DUF4157 domain-containing protein [bacterium]|nr:DUF4157 domain-containing protein [bacterium]